MSRCIGSRQVFDWSSSPFRLHFSLGKTGGVGLWHLPVFSWNRIATAFFSTSGSPAGFEGNCCHPFGRLRRVLMLDSLLVIRVFHLVEVLREVIVRVLEMDRQTVCVLKLANTAKEL